MESVLIPQDSGVIQKVKIVSTYNKKSCTINNKVLICRKKFQSVKDLKKKYLGLISQAKKWTRRRSGLYLRSEKNKVLLIKDSDQFFGTNFKGPIFSEVSTTQMLNLGLFLNKCI